MVLNGARTLRSKVAVNFLDKLAGMSNSGILGQGYLCAFQVMTCTQPDSVEQLPVPLKRKRRLSRHKKNKFSNAPAFQLSKYLMIRTDVFGHTSNIC